MSALALLVLALASTVPSQQPDTLSVEQVKAYYTDLFSVRRTSGGQFHFELGSSKAPLPAGHTLAGLFNGNEHFFLYLVRNWTGIGAEDLTRFAADGDHFPQNLHKALQQDPVFNGHFLPLVGRYLVSQGGALLGPAVPAEPPEVPRERMMDVAVRFFLLDGVDDLGYLTAHICVAINGLLDLPGGRDPYLEALAFLAINKEMKQSQHGVVASFMLVYRQVNGLRLSSDPATRVTRAQGALWAMLQDNAEIWQALTAERSRLEHWLPVRFGA